MIVTLLPPDMRKCREVALRRVAERTKAGRLDPKRHRENFKRHYTGTLGEYALCKHFECKWLGKYFEGKRWDLRTWDTEAGEVRATFYPHDEGGMRIYLRDDRPEAPYIWVNLQKKGSYKNPIAIQAKIVGWAWQSDIHPPQEDWWRGKWWVIPKNHLRPIDSLPTIK